MSLCSPPLLETYREGAVCPSYACLYSSVLSLLQKPVNVRLMSRTVSGNEFQTEGPEAAKLRDPYDALIPEIQSQTFQSPFPENISGVNPQPPGYGPESPHYRNECFTHRESEKKFPYSSQIKLRISGHTEPGSIATSCHKISRNHILPNYVQAGILRNTHFRTYHAR